MTLCLGSTKTKQNKAQRGKGYLDMNLDHSNEIEEEKKLKSRLLPYALWLEGWFVQQ